jgi:hypothetical protein
MAKKIKHSRGFYRELRMELKAANLPKIKRFKSFEFWLKHTSDPSKDIRFYVNWNNEMEIMEGWKFMAGADKEEYEDHVLTRAFDVPKTRKQIAIYRSVLHGIPHLSELS